MRTYVSPIGYDTRRVTRPVIHGGLSSEDDVVMLRPGEETDTERAEQTVADVRQLLHEIEPAVECSVEHVAAEPFEAAVRDCCGVFDAIDGDRSVVASLGGGARDVLLPLTVSAIVYADRIDETLFFSDLDNTVREWTLPPLTAQLPDRATETFRALLDADEWTALSSLADDTDQSKSTVVRHVNDLADVGLVETRMDGKTKLVTPTLAGTLLDATLTL